MGAHDRLLDSERETDLRVFSADSYYHPSLSGWCRIREAVGCGKIGTKAREKTHDLGNPEMYHKRV